MAIREKPKKSTSSKTKTEAKAMEFIQGGGTVAGERHEKSVQTVNVKIPHPLLKRIDKAVGAREVPIYRVQWILEAIAEKLQRDKF